jgi:hypothetical protein
LTYPRRKPSRIALELLNCLDEKEGKASKWDLIKILGNESQFHYWVEEFLLRDKFIAEQKECNHSFYRKTETGELLHKLLKNSKIIQAFLKVSGKRLRRNPIF